MQRQYLAAAVGLLLVAGCTFVGGGDPGALRFERSVGTASGREAYDKAMKIIRQHQFVVERETTAPNLYIETRWRSRRPFPDEMALGIRAIQNRLVVRGSPRNATSLGQLFAITFTIDNRVQIGDSHDWTEAVSTTQFREYAQRISDDLRRELEVGVRRY